MLQRWRSKLPVSKPSSSSSVMLTSRQIRRPRPCTWSRRCRCRAHLHHHPLPQHHRLASRRSCSSNNPHPGVFVRLSRSHPPLTLSHCLVSPLYFFLHSTQLLLESSKRSGLCSSKGPTPTHRTMLEAMRFSGAPTRETTRASRFCSMRERPTLTWPQRADPPLCTSRA